MGYHEQHFESMRELEDWINESSDTIDVVAAFDNEYGATLKYYNRTEDNIKKKDTNIKNYLIMRRVCGFYQYVGESNTYTFKEHEAIKLTEEQARVKAINMNKRSGTGGEWKPYKLARRY